MNNTNYLRYAFCFMVLFGITQKALSMETEDKDASGFIENGGLEKEIHRCLYDNKDEEPLVEYDESEKPFWADSKEPGVWYAETPSPNGREIIGIRHRCDDQSELRNISYDYHYYKMDDHNKVRVVIDVTYLFSQDSKVADALEALMEKNRVLVSEDQHERAIAQWRRFKKRLGDLPQG